MCKRNDQKSCDGQSDNYLPFPVNGACMIRLLHISVQNAHFGEILIERCHLLRSVEFFSGHRFSGSRMILSCTKRSNAVQVCGVVCGNVKSIMCFTHFLYLPMHGRC